MNKDHILRYGLPPDSLRSFIYPLKAIISLIVLLLLSDVSFALVPNPGATCSAGTQGNLTSADYDSLSSNYRRGNYSDMVGSGSIPLQMKMSVVDSDRKTALNVQSIRQGGYHFIRINRESDEDPKSTTNITLNFQKTGTTEPLYLNNVALSFFNIDRMLDRKDREGWDDLVTITGTSKSGISIDGTIQSIVGSTVAGSKGSLFQTGNADRIQCRNKTDTACQGSIVFDEPVNSVTIVFGNTNDVTKTDKAQELLFKVDSYCYSLQSYSISKDDGITSISTNSLTDYIIKVTNTGSAALNNVTLKDPIASGLSKQANITCDANDPNNICSTAPSIAQLEGSGFTIPQLGVGKSYSIKVPTQVTAAAGSSVTNTATISHATLASKSASDNNSVTSIFDGGTSASPAMCPSGHKMYYFGGSPPSGAITPSISWATGSLSNEYNFDNITFKLAFSDILHLQTGYPNYSSYSGVTSNALNMYHNSPYAAVNHRLTATIDRPVSKFGFVVQDLDTSEDRYIESLSFDTSNNHATNGVFSFPNTFNDYLELSNNNQTISGRRWRNCSLTNSCNFNVDWGYQSAGTPFVVTHGNSYNTTSTPGQLMGYSDFYFCLAPPKLIVKKELNGTRINGTRINDTDSKRDQFEITVTGGSIAANSLTTTGTGAVVNNNSSAVLSLAENTRYTITERVMNGAALGEIANYNASYICTNTTTNSTTVMPKAPMSYDAATKTRSFTLADVTYGDEIICTITNTPNIYTFSGTVFNDNGGIDDSQADAHNAVIDSGLYDNANYFNGRFDTPSNPLSSPPYELGIAGSTVKLVDCASPTTVYATQNTAATGNNIGKYEVTVPLSALGGNTNLCLIEESSNNSYSVRTTNSQKVLSFNPSTYNYDNNDFGRVIKANAAVVLKKRQYVHSCSLPLTYSSIKDSNDPNTGFSINPISNIKPEQCIAYKITAINRANVDVDNFIMQDTLQKKGDDNNAVVTSVLALPARENGIYNDGLNTNDNGTIKTIARTLDKRSDFTFYFNTKYGTTNSEP